MTDTSMRENHLILSLLMQHKLMYLQGQGSKFSGSKQARLGETLEKQEGEESWACGVEAERRKDEGQAGELIRFSSIKPESEEESLPP